MSSLPPAIVFILGAILLPLLPRRARSAGYLVFSLLAFVVLLRSPSLHPRTLLRYGVTAEILAHAGVEHEVVDAEGEGPLSQMLSALLLGDFVSFYLAILNQVDPSPVAAIDYLKERLGKIEMQW